MELAKSERLDKMILHDFKEHVVVINKNGDRIVRAKDGSFNLSFNYNTGLTVKFGHTLEDNPTHCPWSPEIADIEVTTKCPGIRRADGSRVPCPWCYKSNTAVGDNMSFENFKHIFDLLTAKKTLTQIAFGADASLESNPDIWKMFEYCRENMVVPNVTVADITPDTAEKIVKLCGAVAVSWYPFINSERCYDTVKLLLDESKKQGKNMQVNIHALLSYETLPLFEELIEHYESDPRLSGMNAIVVLSLKKKGRGEKFEIAKKDDFEKLMDMFFEKKIRFGMDSCSATKFLRYLKKHPELSNLESMVEPCESFGLFSSYINCLGVYYPCSFVESVGDWKNGIDLMKIEDFEKEVWNSSRLCKDRKRSLEMIKKNGCTHCPYYEV